ncbi:hypothetical protein [Wolbachia endosymbiont (group A) of Agelastica alni]|uniref:hypothetical protein n=1 Tax=Wolbachia endosymbiont (group A) of Agelastica alni TaxID=3066130 RepID=UPI003132EA0C
MAVLLSCHPSSLPLLSSQCPDYLDPASFFLDPSVSYSDDIILFWDSSVKHWNDIIGALAISVESNTRKT